MRLGGNNALWSFTARESVFFSAQNETILVIAASSGDPASDGGAAVAFVWNSSAHSFYFHSQTASDPGACSLAHFVIDDKHFVAVANSFTLGKEQSVHIYLWDIVFGLRFQQTLVPDPTDFSPVLYASKLQYFERHGSHFLAVGHLWDGSTYNVASYIYKWEPASQRSQSGSGIVGEGFVAIQMIPIRGCVEVRFLRELCSNADHTHARTCRGEVPHAVNLILSVFFLRSHWNDDC